MMVADARVTLEYVEWWIGHRRMRLTILDKDAIEGRDDGGNRGYDGDGGEGGNDDDGGDGGESGERRERGRGKKRGRHIG